MGPQRTVALLLAVLVTVSALVPIVGASAASSTPRPRPASLVTDATPIPAGSAEWNVPQGTTFRIGLTLAFSHAPQLASYLAAVSSPRSPLYRHFVTHDAFERAFGPSATAVSAVEQALREAGAQSVAMRAGSSTVEALIPASGMQQLLGVTPVEFAAPDRSVVYTVVGAPTLPAHLASVVTGIEGLSGGVGPNPRLSLATVAHPHASHSSAAQFVLDRASGAEWFVGSDYTQAYQATALLPGNASSVAHASYPYHVAIATLLASSYDQTLSTNLPPFDPSVVDEYYAATFPAGWPIPNLTGVPVIEAGAPTPPPPGAFGGFSDTTGYEIENSLDLEMAGSLAPGAPLYNFYFSGSLLANPNTVLSTVAGYLADDLSAALAYNYSGGAGTHLGVVSCSFGLPDLNNSAWDADLQEAAAMGVTVVAASGDQGNAPDIASGEANGPNPLWPATAAFNDSGVVSVGGVSISLVGTPSSNYTGPPLVAAYDPLVQGFGVMNAWYDTSGGFGSYHGSEGGISGVYAEPYWQFHSAAQPNIVNATETQGAGALGRAGPDVAFPANTTIAYVSQSAPGSPTFGLIAGTSVAAPVFAGLVADVVAVETATHGGRFSPLGYIAPEIYRLASYFAFVGGGPLDPFLDVVNGSNAVFSAGVGWDAVTGWGGLLAPLFLLADESPSAERNFTYTGPTPGLPAHPSPILPYLTLLLLIAVVGVAAIAVVVLLSRRRTPPVRAPDVFDPFLLPQAAVLHPGVTPPTFATFACPYCGFDRPAEAGPCPSCGVR